MDRINSADFVDIGGGKRGFRDENLSTGIAGTVVDAAWLNGLQEELLKLIEAAGLVPSAANWTQVRQGISKLVADAIDDYHASDLVEYVADRISEYNLGVMRPYVANYVAVAQNDYHTNIITPFVADRISEYNIGVMRPYVVTYVAGALDDYHDNILVQYVADRISEYDLGVTKPYVAEFMDAWHRAIWINATGARAVNTIYQNNSVGMRQISVSIAGTGAAAGNHAAYLDVSDSPTFSTYVTVAKALSANREDETSQMFAIVSPGKYYRVLASGTTTPTIAVWSEAT